MTDEESENPGDEEPAHFVDGEVTSIFPADGSGEFLAAGTGADQPADSWVDEWSRLFVEDETAKPAVEPPTSEMPVVSAQQPPIGNPVRRDLPGHPDPTARARRKLAPRDPARLDSVPAPVKSEPGGRGEQRPSGRKQNQDAAEMAAWQKAQERSKRQAKLRANQRKAQVMRQQMPESDGLRIEEPQPALVPPGQRSSSQMALVAGGALLLIAVLVGGFLFLGFGTSADDEAAQDVTAGSGDADLEPELDLDLEVGAEVAARGISELALSTVQLVGLNDELEPVCAGSGMIVKEDGTILTNAHVVTSQDDCQFSVIGVGITVNSSSPAQLLYRADVLAVDEELDLAVLVISAPLDAEVAGSPGVPTSFPAAPLGDSDTVELGDNMRILGYPVIGGETITLTTGTVSGFTAQAEVGERALIKTDATISAGNSGGMAVDSDGRVVGIPTKARASESGPAIDCRPLADTNDDGAVDSEDNCVSVGGFLNGIRPVNLALPLLATAEALHSTDSALEETDAGSDVDFDQVAFTNPRFALGEEDDTPVNEIVTATAGIAELCFFADWQGVPDGLTSNGVWFVDGVLDENLGSMDDRWTLGRDGRNFWLCAKEQSALGLGAGVYEVAFFLDGMLIFVEGIELTDQPVEMAEITWTNGTDGDICELAINPLSDSGQVGLNELADGVTIPPEGATTITLPLGTIVAEAYNCEGEPVADAFDGLEVEGTANFLIGL